MTETKKPWPCKVTKGVIEQCWALDEVLELGGVGTRYQGAKMNTMMNMKTMEFSRDLVTLKSGKHSKKGLVMNLCPFCGGELVEGAHAELTKRRTSEDTSQLGKSQ
ncbi:hypothetical protein V1290_000005 [Bradyrhizobium sp. AZCC 1578]|uniref:hypothetical protein n=1 Tax=Bradyrhizobium sp. AZCC 1578 TaxID=3117027 RepID=UPI002FEFEB04